MTQPKPTNPYRQLLVDYEQMSGVAFRNLLDALLRRWDAEHKGEGAAAPGPATNCSRCGHPFSSHEVGWCRVCADWCPFSSTPTAPMRYWMTRATEAEQALAHEQIRANAAERHWKRTREAALDQLRADLSQPDERVEQALRVIDDWHAKFGGIRDRASNLLDDVVDILRRPRAEGPLVDPPVTSNAGSPEVHASPQGGKVHRVADQQISKNSTSAEGERCRSVLNTNPCWFAFGHGGRHSFEAPLPKPEPSPPFTRAWLRTYLRTYTIAMQNNPAQFYSTWDELLARCEQEADAERSSGREGE